MAKDTGGGDAVIHGRLRRGDHNNPALQALFSERPSIEVFVCPCDDVAQANRFEQALVDLFSKTKAEDGAPLAVNIATDDVLRSRKGRPLSEAHKQRMLTGSLGVKRSPEARRNMSLAHAGARLSEKHKAALSVAKTALYSTDAGKAAHARGIEKLSHAIICDGVSYPSKSAAARALGVDVTTVMHRLKSPNYPGYRTAAPSEPHPLLSEAQMHNKQIQKAGRT